MKIAVIGLGYVGLANALMLAEKHEVSGYDISSERVRLLRDGKAPFHDPLILERLAANVERMEAAGSCEDTPGKGLRFCEDAPGNSLWFCENAEDALRDAQMAVICTPTNFDPEKRSFDTESVEESIDRVRAAAPDALILIRSTVPVGFAERMRRAFSFDRIWFCPEFLREGKALYDCENPSRVILGGDVEEGSAENRATAESRASADLAMLMDLFAELLRNDAPILCMGSSEAEAVKLFSNTYLAMRVAFFNEADSFAQAKGLNAGDMIRGICSDPRIGEGYNNPSFGYGGYCLPKDTKQLEAEFGDVPQSLISAVVESNEVRKGFVVSEILARRPSSVGIYRLTMKSGSDNFREAAVLDMIRSLQERGVPVLIYEPMLQEESTFSGCPVIGDLAEFKESADVIAANRYDAELDDVQDKVVTRDLFRRD